MRMGLVVGEEDNVAKVDGAGGCVYVDVITM